MRVYTFERSAVGRLAGARVGKRREERFEPLLRLGMAERRVQPREVGMRYEVDLLARRSDRAFRPSSRTKVDASTHVGV